MTELKPCPFCGGEAEVTDAEEAGPSARVVCCKVCWSSSRVKFALKESVDEQLIDAWNTRAEQKGSA